MKKRILFILSMLLCTSVFSQSFVQKQFNRFTDPDKGHVVFIPKGTRSFGISGAYRNFSAGGMGDADGYSILSVLNIGNGQLHLWNVAPNFNYFVADDLSMGVRLNYSGFLVDTNLKLDFRDMLGFLAPDADDPDADDYDDSVLNVQISSRHMHQHKGGLSFTTRKYLSFFGSRIFGVFGEAALYGNYGVTTSYPLNVETKKIRTSSTFEVGLKFTVGAMVKIRDNSSLSLSIPILGVGYFNTLQNQQYRAGSNQARMSSFKAARDLDFLGLRVAYIHFIEPKKK